MADPFMGNNTGFLPPPLVSAGGGITTEAAAAAGAAAAVGILASDMGGSNITYTGAVNALTGDIHADVITGVANARVQTNGWRVHAKRIVGVLGSPIVFEHIGSAGAAAGTAGAALAATGSLGVNVAGGAGGTAAGSVGSATANLVPPDGGGTLNGHYAGGAGGLGVSGAGAAAGAATSALVSSTRGLGRGGASALAGDAIGFTGVSNIGGGAGGGGGGGDGTAGGGGGAGGFTVWVMAGHMENVLLRSKGGAGGSPAAGNRGGGGGGGGGRAQAIAGTYVNITFDVGGGVGGVKQGTGVNGADGAPGVASLSAYSGTGTSRGLLMGDSIAQNMFNGATSGAILMGPRLVYNIADTGDTIAQQNSVFTAATRYHGAALQFVAIAPLSVNDIRAGVNSTTCVTSLNTLIALIRSNCPGVPIYMTTLSPCKAHLDAINGTYNAQLLLLNTAIRNHGQGGGAISSVNGVYDLFAGLTDGADELLAIYSADGLHLTNLGEDVQATGISALLTAAGL